MKVTRQPWVTDRFANVSKVSIRQRPVRQHMKSFSHISVGELTLDVCQCRRSSLSNCFQASQASNKLPWTLKGAVGGIQNDPASCVHQSGMRFPLDTSRVVWRKGQFAFQPCTYYPIQPLVLCEAIGHIHISNSLN